MRNGAQGGVCKQLLLSTNPRPATSQLSDASHVAASAPCLA